MSAVIPICTINCVKTTQVLGEIWSVMQPRKGFDNQFILRNLFRETYLEKFILTARQESVCVLLFVEVFHVSLLEESKLLL